LTLIRIGISTCPNDTFAFDAILRDQVDSKGLSFEFELLDIEQLNERLIAGDFDIAKTSFAAAGGMSGETWVLPVGAALGFGVGPLLLASRGHPHPTQSTSATPTNSNQTTLCPGRHTTATWLFETFYPKTTQVRQVVFSQIMPMLVDQQADFGVCIHEGRFVWQSQGLYLVEDLGTRWESETNLPLPLGGLVARRSLDPDTIHTACQVIRDSIRMAQANPAQTLPTMRRFAQEFDDRVLMQHVELYVNDWTIDLGEVGRKALQAMSARSAWPAALKVFDA
jgi:1,4-dihydroxy-6-naphthoate synthase